MSMPTTGWPYVEAPRLVALREAFRRRSKAIGNQVRNWTCERLNSGEGESLFVQMDAISLRVWADGVVWVGVVQEASTVSFHASMGLIPPEELVSAAEASLLASRFDELVTSWRRFQPQSVTSRERGGDR